MKNQLSNYSGIPITEENDTRAFAEGVRINLAEKDYYNLTQGEISVLAFIRNPQEYVLGDMAREVLSKEAEMAGRPPEGGTKVPRYSWSIYCQEIGSSRQVVNRWIKRWFDEPNLLKD